MLLLLKERAESILKELEARDNGLSPCAFAVHWALKIAGIAIMAFLDRFPNAAVNADEQRRRRTALYVPLLQLHRDKRSRVVEHTLGILKASRLTNGARSCASAAPLGRGG